LFTFDVSAQVFDAKLEARHRNLRCASAGQVAGMANHATDMPKLMAMIELLRMRTVEWLAARLAYWYLQKTYNLIASQTVLFSARFNGAKARIIRPLIGLAFSLAILAIAL
jgi:hypothetical protein